MRMTERSSMSNLPHNRVPYNGYSLQQTPEGVRLFVNGPWNAEMETLVASGRIHELWLNYAHGFAEPDLEFLRPWPLSELLVLAGWITDLSPIERLGRHLTSLSLPAVAPSAKGTLDLTHLAYLTSLSVSWPLVKDQKEALTPLTDLYLESYSPHDLTPLSAATSLRRLSMKQYPQLRSLDGLASFEQLNTLGIFLASKLEDVSALRTAPAVQTISELHLDVCKKISTFEDVAFAKNIRFLSVANSGDFPSLTPLTGMPKVRQLHLYESTRIVDGDLRPILSLPQLQELRLANRRHYSPQVGEIERQLGIQH